MPSHVLVRLTHDSRIPVALTQFHPVPPESADFLLPFRQRPRLDRHACIPTSRDFIIALAKHEQLPLGLVAAVVVFTKRRHERGPSVLSEPAGGGRRELRPAGVHLRAHGLQPRKFGAQRRAGDEVGVARVRRRAMGLRDESGELVEVDRAAELGCHVGRVDDGADVGVVAVRHAQAADEVCAVVCLVTTGRVERLEGVEVGGGQGRDELGEEGAEVAAAFRDEVDAFAGAEAGYDGRWERASSTPGCRGLIRRSL